MSKFELLTKHIPTFEGEDFGEWHPKYEQDGSKEQPLQFPFVLYSKKIRDFEEDVYRFVDLYPEMGLRQYGSILDKNGIDMAEIDQADISNIDAECICAMIVAIIRAERLCDGAILSFCMDGIFKKWLIRLKEIDS